MYGDEKSNCLTLTIYTNVGIHSLTRDGRFLYYQEISNV